MNTPTPEDNKIVSINSSETFDEQHTRELGTGVNTVNATGDPLLGMVVADRYDVSSIIGIGGWSVVYKAYDKTLERPIAIKALHAHLCVDQTKLLRFKREAESASKLNHPNIAVIYDCGDLWPGRPYISMELIEGVSLTELLQTKGQLATVEFANLFSQICDGIEAIHNLGLIHRDLKPSNIKISDAGIAKVLDFGLAKWILQDQDALTRSDESLGTPTYMSPEQCLGKPLDARSDIYSLGCMMYETVTGVKPFTADNSLRYMQMHVQTMPPKFKEIKPDLKVPDYIELIVFKALAKDPQDRFASAHEIKAALNDPLYARSLTGKVAKFKIWHLPAARRIALITSAMVVGLLIAANLVSTWQQSKQATKEHTTQSLQGDRTIQFPDEVVGNLFLLTRFSDGHAVRGKKIVNARGATKVPEGALIELTGVPPDKSASVTFLAKLKPEDLQYITMSGSQLNDDGLANINKLTGVQSINADETMVTDAGVEKLDLQNLGGLNLKGTKVTDASMPHIAAVLERLGWLSVRKTAVTDKGASILFEQLHLKSIDLSETKISDACLKNIGKESRISSLKLAGDEITDAGVESLSSLKSLKTLNLRQCKITDKSIVALSRMRQLKDLDISTTGISNTGFERLKKSLPDCAITHLR